MWLDKSPSRVNYRCRFNGGARDGSEPAAGVDALCRWNDRVGDTCACNGDFALVWQPVAAWVPGRTGLAYASGVLMLLVGAGLLFSGTVRWSVRILFPYLIVWTLLKVPGLVAAPQIEGVWLGLGELVMLLAGGWTLFAVFAELPEGSVLGFATGEKGIRIARILFAIWVIPVGLSHFFYTKATVDLVPAWLPFRTGWAYLTGAGHIASGIGLLFSRSFHARPHGRRREC